MAATPASYVDCGDAVAAGASRAPTRGPGGVRRGRCDRARPGAKRSTRCCDEAGRAPAAAAVARRLQRRPPASPPRRPPGPASPTARAPRRGPVPDWERKVAAPSRSSAGGSPVTYEVDEFGFDAELTDTGAAGRDAAALRPLLPGRGARPGEHPVRGRRARRRQPLRHHPARLGDDPDRPARPPPGAAPPAHARRRPRLPDAVRRHAGTQERHDAGLQRRRGAAARAGARSSGSGRRGSRGSASPSPSATSCSGSAGAGSCRPLSRRRCRSCRARSSGPRRSTRSSATSRRWRGCSACRTCR